MSLLKRRKDPQLERSIADAMTINETSFFRDSRPFELLRTELLPKLIEAQETFAQPAILECGLLDGAGELQPWHADGGTLSDAGALGCSNRGDGHLRRKWWPGRRLACYHRIEMNRGLPARHVVRYFDHQGEDWAVKPEIRKMCNFRQANLCGPQLPFRRASDKFRRDLAAQRDAVLFAGNAKDAAGERAQGSDARWGAVPGIERAAGRWVDLDLGAGGRNVPF